MLSSIILVVQGDGRGDVPKMMLSIDKLKELGWKNEWESEKSVRETVKALLGK